MKKIVLAVVLAILGGVVVGSAESDSAFPVATKEDIKGLTWNRFTTGPDNKPNFVVLSLDEKQGRWMQQNIEKMKSWCITRWGFPDVQLGTECRIHSVQNKDMLKKLFNLDQSKYEVVLKNGKVDVYSVWVALDEQPSKTLPTLLTPIVFAEFENKYGVKLPWFSIRGMSCLNSNLTEVRTQLASIIPRYKSSEMFTMSQDGYDKLSDSDKRSFDTHAAVLCLMLRKEFGEAKMQGFLRLCSKNPPEIVLNVVYGFTSFAHFDSSYTRYMRELAADIAGSKTPDSYLDIKPIR